MTVAVAVAVADADADDDAPPAVDADVPVAVDVPVPVDAVTVPAVAVASAEDVVAFVVPAYAKRNSVNKTALPITSFDIVFILYLLLIIIAPVFLGTLWLVSAFYALSLLLLRKGLSNTLHPYLILVK